MTRPRFPLGSTVYVDPYLGVVPADHPHPKSKCWVTAARAAATVEAGEDGETPTLIQPAGWEYRLHHIRTGDEWGWVPEADLDAHYSPSEPQPQEAA